MRAKTRPPRRYVVSRSDQLAALASPARQEIVDVLSRMGTVSAAEIAGALGRPADGLYYHLRTLTRAGLVVTAGKRVRAAREEALYRTVAPEVMLRHEAGTARRVGAIVGAMLRLGARDFRRASAAGGARTSGPRRELWALRATGWVVPAGLTEVNRRMRALRDSVFKPPGRGRLYGITILLTPLDHRARKAQRRPRRAKRRSAS